MQVGFEGRTPTPDDTIRIGMIDLADNDRWTELGTSRAWSWQQGCMLQWLPGTSSEIIWNDREGDRFISHVLDVKSGTKRTLPAPIYAISPDARWAVHCDFRRLHDTRPGYGYAGIADPNRDVLAPDNSGIWRMDLQSGKHQMLASIQDVAAVKDEQSNFAGAKQWVNHLLYSPDGTRFCFLHRWSKPGLRSFTTRLITTTKDGKDMFVLDPYGKTSHFIWHDPQHILAWAWNPSDGEKFYFYRDGTREVKVVGPDVMIVNGHCTYLPPDKKWILNDTYPDKNRNQNPYLYEIARNRRVPLGHLHSPPQYKGEFRCDLHPRYSRDGTKVVVDSPHGGNGRQMYLIDVAEIVQG